MIAYYLLKETKPGHRPAGPREHADLRRRPGHRRAVAGAGRNSVGAKSPLTGGFGDAEAGGFFGAELKHAGFDAVIVEGQADKPVYLGSTTARPSCATPPHLWGKTTGETEATMRAELGENDRCAPPPSAPPARTWSATPAS